VFDLPAILKQIGKQILTLALWLGTVSLVSLPAPAHGQALVTTVVTNPLTGIAIDGLDPVSYFTGPEPRVGRADFEFVWNGVPWHFASAANRDVFLRNPEVYAPRFGGYGAMSLARGFLSKGNPRIYLVRNQKLYLFYSAGNRDAFQLAPEAAIANAEKNWPILSAGLSGP
jgi:YHS domain-containing protein